MSEAERQPKPEDPHASTEGALIRLLAPTRPSRPRLLILALLFVAWITFLIGLYLSTKHQGTRNTPSATTMAMAFPQ